jgi:predicted alpha-1,2-mannosidase
MIKNILLVFLLFFGIVAGTVSQQIKQPVDYVNPFIGSQDSRWFAFTPAALPFGMVKLAPMTFGYNGYSGGGGRSGYDYTHKTIFGFSHVHEYQTGGILVMPTVGKLRTVPGDEVNILNGYRSPYSKTSEKAGPGFYSVFLDRYEINVELTATTRIGYHKYTFPASDSSHIIFDTGHLLGEAGSYGVRGAESKEVLGAGIEILSPLKIQGYTFALPEYQVYRNDLQKSSVRVYFAAILSKPAKSYGCYRDNTHNDNRRAEYGRGCGAYLNFKTAKDEVIEVRVAISFVSMEQAWENLKAEDTGKTFEQVRNDARILWNNELSKIEIEGGTEKNRIKFYTSLYQVLLGRGVCSDANGKYISNFNEIKQLPLKNGVPEYNHYSNDGLWGAFGNLIQVWSLVCPEHMNSYIRCMLDVYDETGWLPDGLTCDKFMPGMESNQMTTMIACALNRGIAKFDAGKAYQACFKSETEFVDRPAGVGKSDLKYFWDYGYIPVDKSGYNGTSHTLENSFSCWVTAQIAKKLGKRDDYTRLINASENWKNVFDPEYGFFNSRYSDGTFMRPFSPLKSHGFEEGNILQYSFFVPHDMISIVNKMGKTRSIELLDSIFTIAEKSNFVNNDVYFHGNQPALLNAYVFNYAGKSWLTQKWVRAIENKFYDNMPFCYKGGDEDQGQLTGWLVLAALGLMDISGGCAIDQQLYICTPLFPKITIHLNKDYYHSDTFTILSKNFSEKNLYIKSARLNGTLLKELHFDFNRIHEGSTLVLELGDSPKK